MRSANKALNLARFVGNRNASCPLIGKTFSVGRRSTSIGLFQLSTSRNFNTSFGYDRAYKWVDLEAEELIGKAYQRHKALADSGESFPPSLSAKDLEALGEVYHYEPVTVSDKVAKGSVIFLEKLMGLFFREKYDHHACTLECLAAVPGIVAAAFRHLRSLRNMQRDHGWINPLLEEAENERMHLLIWLQHTKPTMIERAFVMVAQTMYMFAYASMYAVSPKTAHRAVGYLEEAAHRAYCEYLEAVDSGAIKNVPAGKIAKEYYRLPDDAMLRDVILHVR